MPIAKISYTGTITLWAISRDILRGPRLFWVIVPQKKIMSRSFLNSGTLIVITYPSSVHNSFIQSHLHITLHFLHSLRHTPYIVVEPHCHYLATPPLSSAHLLWTKPHPYIFYLHINLVEPHLHLQPHSIYLSHTPYRVGPQIRLPEPQFHLAEHTSFYVTMPNP